MRVVRYSDRYFGDASRSEESGAKTAHGVFVTMGGQGIKFVLQFGSMMVMARLLTPEDFGLIGMVAVFVNFLSLFKEFGLSQAVIQAKVIERRQISSLFWINVGICCCIGILLLAVAPGVARFYDREELTFVTMLMGLGIILQSFGLQHRSLLLRTMQFKRVEIVEFLAMLCGLAVAIFLGCHGYGYWALVWQALIQAFVVSIGYILACRWLPCFHFSYRDCASLLRFGGGVFSENIVNYFSRNSDNILIGKFVGAGPLGLYSKAYQLLMLPIQQVTGPVSKVVLPSLSRLQDNPAEFRRRYLQFIRLITVINVPVIIYLGVFAELVVEVVFGAQWLAIVDVYRCLVPAALMGATNVAGGWVMTPLGKVSKQFKVSLTSSTVHVLAIAIGLRWGLIGVALAVSLSRFIMKFIMLGIAYQGTKIRLRDFVDSQVYPLCFSLLAVCVAWFVGQRVVVSVSLLQVVASVTSFGLTYLLLSLLDVSLRADLKQMFDVFKRRASI